MAIVIRPPAGAHGSVNLITPVCTRSVSRSADVAELIRLLATAGYGDTSVWSDAGTTGVWLNDGSCFGVNLIKQNGKVTGYDVMIRHDLSVARYRKPEVATSRLDIERQSAARESKEGLFQGEHAIARANPEFGSLLLVIYPERACAMANDLLGRRKAGAARTAFKAAIRTWIGSILTIESFRDNEALWGCPSLIDAINDSILDNAFAGYETNTIREWAHKPPTLMQLIRRKLLDWGMPATTPILVTGAFYRHDGRGSVHQFRREIKRLGYENVQIGPGAIVDSRGNAKSNRVKRRP